MNEWQAIETAPKDCRYLLVWEDCSQAAVIAQFANGRWYERDFAGVIPTNWMPLPEPPK